MVVNVRLHTTLRRVTPEGVIDRLTLDLPQQSTVQAVLDTLGISVRDDAILLVVNGRIAETATTLTEGDEVRLIPAMSGGWGRP